MIWEASNRKVAGLPVFAFDDDLPMDLVSHMQMCNNLHMPTNLAIDDKLIEEARRLGEHKTKKEAVTTALEEYIQHRRQQLILQDFGTIDFDPEYDYKAERRRKRM